MRADTLRGLAAAAVLAMASAALAHDDDDDDGLRFVRFNCLQEIQQR
jgi:hypothetical protein